MIAPMTDKTPIVGGVILVVDDEPQIHRFLKPALETAGFSALRAETGAQALRIAATASPNLVLLDLGLSDMDGQEVLAKLREFSEVPVIVLSARDHETEKIKALDSGANDYVEKPFGMGELLARIRNMLRWPTQINKNNEVTEFEDIKIYDNSMKIIIEDVEIFMTKIQYKLLKLLIQNRGNVLTHEYILKAVWGKSHEQDVNYLRIYISQIRKKLGKYGDQHIKTRTGIGYCFE